MASPLKYFVDALDHPIVVTNDKNNCQRLVRTLGGSTPSWGSVMWSVGQHLEYDEAVINSVVTTNQTTIQF